MKKAILCILCATLILCYCPLPLNAAESKIVFSKSREYTKKIALTFDDGPHPRYTEKILSILRKYDVKATFFVIGVNAENYPEPLKRVYEEGHELGNHSYSHTSEKTISEENAREEINKCENIIYDNLGITPKLFRPPQGLFSCEVEKVAAENNYSIILWSIDTKDWAHNPSKSIAKTIEENLKGGDIILMHDYISGENTTCDALEIIIPHLLEKGYEFVTVSELIADP